MTTKVHPCTFVSTEMLITSTNKKYALRPSANAALPHSHISGTLAAMLGAQDRRRARRRLSKKRNNNEEITV